MGIKGEIGPCCVFAVVCAMWCQAGSCQRDFLFLARLRCGFHCQFFSFYSSLHNLKSGFQRISISIAPATNRPNLVDHPRVKVGINRDSISTVKIGGTLLLETIAIQIYVREYFWLQGGFRHFSDNTLLDLSLFL